MKDWIVNLTAIMANGNIIKTAQRAKKSSAGYNLNSLICGSEGTLALIGEITLKLAPAHKIFQVAAIPFANLENATNAVIETIQNSIDIQCIEILDDNMVNAINKHANPYFPENMNVLLCKFSGNEQNEIDKKIEKVMEITKKHNRDDNIIWSKNQAHANTIWGLRKNCFWIFQKVKPKGRIWATDACVPISKLSQAVMQFKNSMKGLNFYFVYN